MKRLAIYLGIIIVASACYDLDKPKKPDNLISKDKMVEILIDAKIVASISSNSVNRKVILDHGVKLNSYVYRKHNIDSLQFALSNAYYSFYIKDYEEIYLKVKDSLDTLLVKFKKEAEIVRIEKEKRRIDSLKLVFKEMDSLGLLKVKDSVGLLKIKDTLVETLIQKVFEEKRIIDSLKVVFKDMDSLGLLKVKDSIELLKTKDTLADTLIQDILEEKGRLIAPISDKDHQ
ncbi:DUF4296 domain-containing protein [Flavivirga jejuensis]|uniref:DUF4296 domain-containing protein n=1 Tax=Flavivirga jejuensis TaxID=870487 RepID=A0ABT8WIG7_9FLAO|nr:DUF4296 domain-containing protein [Flavivirga jejuensis]MDO5972922.1 DUF4296 domain-containing protein [Flavivirga jejuensis]